jgi:hypothetical protein
MHYTVHTLHDGTVLAAYPVRKPSPQLIKRDRLRIDEDGVAIVFSGPGRELSHSTNESRTRFQNIIAENLNTRRALRELILPPLHDLRTEVSALRAEVAALREEVAKAYADRH